MLSLHNPMRLFSVITAGLMALPTLASAEDVKQKGFEIAARSDRSDRGFGDTDVKLTMVLRNAAGDESKRSMRIKTLEIPDESKGDKSLVTFNSPADVSGTSLLSHARILDPDDQWLYLPALKRTKRISSVNKSGPFVGSEFAFEDFTSLELGKFDYTWLRTETHDGLPCDVIERTPKYEHSGYTRQLAWIDQTDHQLRKVEFFDRKGSKLKTLTLTDYRKYEGQFWRVHKMSMVNHQTGKSTDMLYSDYRFKAGLSDKDFVKGVLRRAR